MRPKMIPAAPQIDWTEPGLDLLGLIGEFASRPSRNPGPPLPDNPSMEDYLGGRGEMPGGIL